MGVSHTLNENSSITWSPTKTLDNLNDLFTIVNRIFRRNRVKLIVDYF